MPSASMCSQILQEIACTLDKSGKHCNGQLTWCESHELNRFCRAFLQAASYFAFIPAPNFSVQITCSQVSLHARLF
jgi:hypothetical protein